MSAPVPYTCHKIDHAIAILEELRGDNDELRQWGLSLERELDEAEAKIDDLREKIMFLEDQIDDLKRTKMNLENRIDSLICALDEKMIYE